MALLRNDADYNVDLSTGRLLNPGAEAAGDASNPHEAALIARHILFIVDPDVPPPPEPSFRDGLINVARTDEAQGDLIARGADGWVNIPAGEDGQILETRGPDRNPRWVDPADVPDVSGLQDDLDALEGTTTALAATVVGKQDAATAATDYELAAQAAVLKALRTPKPSPLLYMVFGDSAAANFGDSFNPATTRNAGANGASSSAGWLTAYSRGRVMMGHNAGVSGNTTAAALARFQTDVVDVIANTKPWIKLLIIEIAGGNDWGACAVATTIANLTAMYEAAKPLGIPVVICTLPVRDTGPAGTLGNYPSGTYTAAQYFARVTATNKAIRDYAFNNAGQFFLVDIHGAVVDPITGTYRAGYSFDGTHWTGPGSRETGRVLAEAVDHLAGSYDGLATSANEDQILFTTPSDYFFNGAASNDKQFISAGVPTGGSYTLEITAGDAALFGVPAGITGAIAWNANATAVKAAIEAVWPLATITATGNSAPWDHYVTWGGAYAGITMPLFTVHDSTTGGAGVTVLKTVPVGATVGGVSSGWSLGVVGTARASLEARSDGLGYWQVIEILANGTAVTLGHSVTTGLIVVNDVIYCEAEVAVPDDIVNAVLFEMWLSESTPAVRNLAVLNTQGTVGALPANPGPSHLVLRTPTKKNDQAATFTNLALYLSGDAGTRIKVGRAGVRKWN